MPPVSFLAPRVYPVGRVPQSIALGDFNKDGLRDLAVANSFVDNLSILLGQGDGTFQPAVNYSTGTRPNCIVVGDFNGDGNQDLAVANSSSNNVSILLGNGDGTFQAAVNYNAGTGSIFLAVGDFNGDGKQDLAVASPGSHNVSILLGRGDGSFQASVGYPGGDRPDAGVSIVFNASAKASIPDHAQAHLSIPPTGVNTFSTGGSVPTVSGGSAAVDGPMYGTAVFSLTQNGSVVSEAGVPASPPTTAARIFIDYRNGVPNKADAVEAGGININTGVAMVNRGVGTAHPVFVLRDRQGQSVTAGSGMLPPNSHRALFVDQLGSFAPGFNLPAGFASGSGLGSLEILSDQPLSITALRLTTNERGDTLITTTPVADEASPPLATQLFFPQLVDGGGYKTTLVFMNTSDTMESGILSLFGDDGLPLALRPVEGVTQSSFIYQIQPHGVVVFQTDGSSETVKAGWAQWVADGGMTAPAGAGVFSYTQNGTLVTESGIPNATPTMHARIYLDKSRGHDTGLAIALPGRGSSGGGGMTVNVGAFQLDGITAAGSGMAQLNLDAFGHEAKFAGELIGGLPDGFTGVLDVSSSDPFVALTLRSLVNTRGDFLLTTFPIADFSRPAPPLLVFPQIADGGGYRTQFILINPNGSAMNTTLSFYDDNGSAWAVSY